MMSAAGLQFYMYTAPRFLEFAKQFLGLKFDTKKAESELEQIEKQDRQAVEYGTFRTEDYFNYGMPLNYQGWQWNRGYIDGINFQWNTAPQSLPWTPPSEPESKKSYLALLPINGTVYYSSTGKWRCEIVSAPESHANDRACYQLKFEPEDRARGSRYLKLWVSLAGLDHDPDWRYKRAITRIISEWLGSNQGSGEIVFVP